MVGTPHPRLGEVVSAWVVVKPPPAEVEGCPPGQPLLTAGALQAHCQSQGLPGYALPRRVLTTTARLPRTSMGKVVGAVVRQSVMELGEEGETRGGISRL